MRRITGILAVMVIVIYMAVTVLSSGGALLCFGEDGHVAVEFVDACNSSDSGMHLSGAASDACGSCEDVLFQSNPAHTGNASQHALMLPAQVSSAFTPSLPPAGHSHPPVHLPEYCHHKTLSSLHTVILLI